jgi:hypothetical protein
MEKVALGAATLAALAVIVLCVKLYALISRAESVVERLGRLVESEVGSALRSWEEAARGVQAVAGKLDDGLEALASTLHRVDRITAKLEPEVLRLTAIQPTVAKVASWLSGIRKGLAGAVGQRPKADAGDGVETELG